MSVLFSNNCPKCTILKGKMDAEGIQYEISNDFDILREKGFTSLPVLKTDEGTYLNFNEAVKYVQLVQAYHNTTSKESRGN